MNSNQIDTEGIEAIKLDLKRRHKEAFDEQLAISIINAAKENIEVKKQWSRAEYQVQLEKIKKLKEIKSNKHSKNYHLLNMYDVVKFGDVEKIIKKPKEKEDKAFR